MSRPKRVLYLTALAALAALFLAQPPAVLGQELPQVNRKIKSQITPVYPDLARRLNVRGKVKLQVTVAADGSVKSMHALGGHPILVGASQDAVGKWKFEPAQKDTTQIIEVNFD